jgi:hypothetical protein
MTPPRGGKKKKPGKGGGFSTSPVAETKPSSVSRFDALPERASSKRDVQTERSTFAPTGEDALHSAEAIAASPPVKAPRGDSASPSLPTLPPGSHPDGDKSGASRDGKTSSTSADVAQPGADHGDAGQNTTSNTAQRDAAEHARAQREEVVATAGKPNVGYPNDLLQSESIVG